MRTDAARTGRSQGPAWLLCALLAAAGGALAAVDGWDAAAPAPFTLPWPALAALYILAQRLTVDFEFRQQSRSITLGQLPLALGAVALAPGLHLLSRLVGTGAVCLVRRQAPVRAAFNLSIGAVEVGAVTAAFHVFGVGTQAPGTALWTALVTGLLLGELIGQVALAAVWRLLGMPVSREQLLQPLLFGLASTVVFAAVAIVAVAAVWMDPLITVVILLLVGALAAAYRGHRRLSAQQQTTEQLYEFVKELGPLEASAEETRGVLEHLRVLLHSRYLDLAYVDDSGHWCHAVVWEGGTAEDRPEHLVALAGQVAATGSAALRGRNRSGNGDEMATPLLGSSGLIGILTASHRLGDVRGFDMGDLRLLETVAAELATALERGQMLAALGKAATTDPLTDLPNLADTTRRVAELLDGNPDGVMLAAIAVDSFREVNDTLGHQVGDELLLEVTRRLTLSYSGALIGRIGGGRFAVAVPVDPFHTTAAAEMFGLGIRAQIEGGTQIGPVGTHIRLSVGVVQAPEHGSEAATLLRRAETAMYSARHVHGGPVLWEPAYEVKGQRRLAVVTALREAVANGAISLAYQPKVDAVSGAATGVEALARWTHPALGMIRPDEFIPLAEASGLMGALTTSVLRQALSDCKDWQRKASRVGVAVNVSADTVLDPAFVTEVAAVLTSVGIAPELLTLELTEGVVVGDPQLAVERMNELRALGVRISVDDFGTGYSSLTYLKGLPVDEVKVDKTFVDGLSEDPADRAVVRAVVDIAHTLGLKVVAEGVEQEQQMGLLRSLGVDETQGYLHARPMTAPDAAAWLDNRHTALR
jgi:diguanylate cyclase (GGDEF)-like protein